MFGQIRVFRPEGDGIVASCSARTHELELGILLGVVQSDRQVQQDGVQPAELQVAIRFGLAVVDALMDLQFVQQPLGRRVLQGADHAAESTALLQRLETRLVRAGDQLQGVHVVRMTEAHNASPVRRDFQTVHGEVKIPPLQPRHQAAELVLDKVDLRPSSSASASAKSTSKPMF